MNTLIVFLVALSLLASSCAGSSHARFESQNSTANTGSRRKVVVLVHGLFRTTWSMRPLKNPIEAVGFDVESYRYFSTRGTVEDHGEEFFEKLAQLENDPTVEEIHVVTHSLGGVVTRAALTHGSPSKLERVVMLAPPNKGSTLATLFAPYFGGLIRPLADVAHDPAQRRGTLLDQPAQDGIEVGVIAGAKDTTVDLQFTHLQGQVDHVVVDTGHTFIMHAEETKQQVIHFLLTGSFLRDHAQSEAPQKSPSRS